MIHLDFLHIGTGPVGRCAKPDVGNVASKYPLIIFEDVSGLYGWSRWQRERRLSRLRPCCVGTRPWGCHEYG